MVVWFRWFHVVVFVGNVGIYCCFENSHCTLCIDDSL